MINTFPKSLHIHIYIRANNTYSSMPYYMYQYSFNTVKWLLLYLPFEPYVHEIHGE